MADPQRFSTTLHLIGRNTGVVVPEDVLEALGGGRRPAVDVAVNGYRYRSTVAIMGGKALIPFSAEHRAASGIAGNDAIDVELSLDTAPREVAVPEDLAAALEEAGATDAFARLAPSHRKAHVASVEGAKAPETRRRRIDAAVAKVQAGS